jgi:hypothetical protein
MARAAADPSKLRPRAAQLLRAFRDAPHHTLTTHECADVAGYGYSSRISEIRAHLRYLGTGERIESKPVRGRAGAYLFKLTKTPAAGVDAAATTTGVCGDPNPGSGVDSGGRSEEDAGSLDPANPDADSSEPVRLFEPRPGHDDIAA